MGKKWPTWNTNNEELETDIKQKFEEVSSEIEEKTKTYYDNKDAEDVLDYFKIKLPTLEEIKELNENAEKQSIDSVELDEFGVMAIFYDEIRKKASETTNYKQIIIFLQIEAENIEKCEWFLKNSSHIVELFENNGYGFKYEKFRSGNIFITIKFNKDGTPYKKRNKYN